MGDQPVEENGLASPDDMDRPGRIPVGPHTPNGTPPASPDRPRVGPRTPTSTPPLTPERPEHRERSYNQQQPQYDYANYHSAYPYDYHMQYSSYAHQPSTSAPQPTAYNNPYLSREPQNPHPEYYASHQSYYQPQHPHYQYAQTAYPMQQMSSIVPAPQQPPTSGMIYTQPPPPVPPPPPKASQSFQSPSSLPPVGSLTTTKTSSYRYSSGGYSSANGEGYSNGTNSSSSSTSSEHHSHQKSHSSRKQQFDSIVGGSILDVLAVAHETTVKSDMKRRDSGRREHRAPTGNGISHELSRSNGSSSSNAPQSGSENNYFILPPPPLPPTLSSNDVTKASPSPKLSNGTPKDSRDYLTTKTSHSSRYSKSTTRTKSPPPVQDGSFSNGFTVVTPVAPRTPKSAVGFSSSHQGSSISPMTSSNGRSYSVEVPGKKKQHLGNSEVSLETSKERKEKTVKDERKRKEDKHRHHKVITDEKNEVSKRQHEQKPANPNRLTTNDAPSNGTKSVKPDQANLPPEKPVVVRRALPFIFFNGPPKPSSEPTESRTTTTTTAAPPAQSITVTAEKHNKETPVEVSKPAVDGSAKHQKDSVTAENGKIHSKEVEAVNSPASLQNGSSHVQDKIVPEQDKTPSLPQNGVSQDAEITVKESEKIETATLDPEQPIVAMDVSIPPPASPKPTTSEEADTAHHETRESRSAVQTPGEQPQQTNSRSGTPTQRAASKTDLKQRMNEFRLRMALKNKHSGGGDQKTPDQSKPNEENSAEKVNGPAREESLAPESSELRAEDDEKEVTAEPLEVEPTENDPEVVFESVHIQTSTADELQTSSESMIKTELMVETRQMSEPLNGTMEPSVAAETKATDTKVADELEIISHTTAAIIETHVEVLENDEVFITKSDQKIETSEPAPQESLLMVQEENANPSSTGSIAAESVSIAQVVQEASETKLIEEPLKKEIQEPVKKASSSQNLVLDIDESGPSTSNPRKRALSQKPIVTKASLKQMPTIPPTKKAKLSKKGKAHDSSSPSQSPPAYPLSSITLPRSAKQEEVIRQRRSASALRNSEESSRQVLTDGDSQLLVDTSSYPSSELTGQNSRIHTPIYRASREKDQKNNYESQTKRDVERKKENRKRAAPSIPPQPGTSTSTFNGFSPPAPYSSEHELKKPKSSTPKPSAVVRGSSLHTPNTSDSDHEPTDAQQPTQRKLLGFQGSGEFPQATRGENFMTSLQQHREFMKKNSNVCTSRDSSQFPSIPTSGAKMMQDMKNGVNGSDYEEEEEEDVTANGGETTLAGLMYPKVEEPFASPIPVAPLEPQKSDAFWQFKKAAEIKEEIPEKRCEALTGILSRQASIGGVPHPAFSSAIRNLARKTMHRMVGQNRRSNFARSRAMNGEFATKASTRLLKSSAALDNLPKISYRFRQFIRARTHPNGGARILSCDYSIVKEHLSADDVSIFFRQFNRLGFAERDGVPFFAIVVVENGAEDMGDLFMEIVNEIPNLQIKAGKLTSKQYIETYKIKEYQLKLYENLYKGTFSHGPLMSISLVGAKQEEAGALYQCTLKALNNNPFTCTMTPWGDFSETHGMRPQDSDDGPIMWIRPGEQMVPTDTQKINDRVRHPNATRVTERREVEFLDRTYCHADQVQEGNMKKSTAAVGVLQAIKPPGRDGEQEEIDNEDRRILKEVVVFDAADYKEVCEYLAIDVYEPPVSQCTTWVDDAKLNYMRKMGIHYAKLELRDNDLYFLPRNVVHQFRTINACLSIAWHVRLMHYSLSAVGKPITIDDPDNECESDYSDAEDYGPSTSGIPPVVPKK